MKIALSLIISFYVFGLNAQPNLPKYALKKIDKTLNALWDGKKVVLNMVDISEDIKNQNKLPITLEIYRLHISNSQVGYLCINEADSQYDTFTYLAIYKLNLHIKTIQVLIYREDYGGEIGSKKWLKQFEGKGIDDTFEFGKDIRNISGATISTKSITHSVQKLTRTIHELNKLGILTHSN